MHDATASLIVLLHHTNLNFYQGNLLFNGCDIFTKDFTWLEDDKAYFKPQKTNNKKVRDLALIIKLPDKHAKQ